MKDFAPIAVAGAFATQVGGWAGLALVVVLLLRLGVGVLEAVLNLMTAWETRPQRPLARHGRKP
jgi:hypothetical protein